MASLAGVGSSPRMRGTQAGLRHAAEAQGIIPAYAGNTSTYLPCYAVNMDHPRVCGEHAAEYMANALSMGSSPRMRGTHRGRSGQRHCKGIIPAYAGNTKGIGVMSSSSRDHPRVCGEHLGHDNGAVGERGSSPRMRGTLGRQRLARPDLGIIPAYAGNTLRDYSNFVVSKFMSFVFHLV